MAHFTYSLVLSEKYWWHFTGVHVYHLDKISPNKQHNELFLQGHNVGHVIKFFLAVLTIYHN